MKRDSDKQLKLRLKRHKKNCKSSKDSSKMLRKSRENGWQKTKDSEELLKQTTLKDQMPPMLRKQMINKPMTTINSLRMISLPLSSRRKGREMTSKT